MIKKLLSYYIYSNLHISIAAGVYVAGAFAISGTVISYFWAGLVSIATYVVYNAHRYIGYYQTTSEHIAQRILFIKKYRWQLTGLCFAGLALLFFSFPVIRIQRLLPYIPLIVITGLYLLPILPNKKRLRDLPYIKIFLIAIVWAAVFATIYYTFTTDSRFMKALTLFLEKSLFFLLITIPFDYRDRHIDRSQGVATLATALTSKSLRMVMIVLSILIAVALIVQYQIQMIDITLFISLLSCYLISLGLSLWGLSSRSELYYLGVLDGLILFNGLIYLIQ